MHAMAATLSNNQPKDLNPVWLAQSRLRRRRFDECIEICTGILARNPYDQAVWYLKCRALTLKNWIDDTEIEEEGIADQLLDENQTAQAPRPGTSLARPMTGAQGGSSLSPSVRPLTGSGRPITGFARPGTSSRGGTSGGAGPGGRLGTASLEAALRQGGAGRPGTSLNRPVTSSGRFVRLGTASLLSEPGGPFINSDKVDLRKYAARPALARALVDYIIYVDHNIKRGLELCALCTQASDFKDWWWKARLGKCYYQLGLLRDADKQLRSSIKNQEMLVAVQELAKVCLRLDQPVTALELYTASLQAHPGDTDLLLGVARVYDALGDTDKSLQFYKNVLYYDASNVEAIACLAAHHFYTDQPEIALRYYRRLLQMGVTNTELWTNLGLCCFYASQYDMCLGCFERALQLADDSNVADVWYNMSQVAIGIGDTNLAWQCGRIAVALDPGHVEALTNLGVLEWRKGADAQAAALFRSAQQTGGHAFEPFFNGALLAFKFGNFQDSFEQVTRALDLYPDHTDSQELLKQLKAQFTML